MTCSPAQPRRLLPATRGVTDQLRLESRLVSDPAIHRQERDRVRPRTRIASPSSEITTDPAAGAALIRHPIAAESPISGRTRAARRQGQGTSTPDWTSARCRNDARHPALSDAVMRPCGSPCPRHAALPGPRLVPANLPERRRGAGQVIVLKRRIGCRSSRFAGTGSDNLQWPRRSRQASSFISVA